MLKLYYLGGSAIVSRQDHFEAHIRSTEVFRLVGLTQEESGRMAVITAGNHSQIMAPLDLRLGVGGPWQQSCRRCDSGHGRKCNAS